MTDTSENKPSGGSKDSEDTNKPVAVKADTATDTAAAGGKASATATTPATGSAAGGRNTTLLSVLALLLALAAIGAAGYLWQGAMQQRGQLADSRADIAGTTQRVDSQDQQLREMQRQLDRQRDSAGGELKALSSRLDTMKRQLDAQQKRLQSLTTTDREDWLLAEAEYLIRLANQRLLMGKEIAGARKLLQAADKILLELDDAGLYSVRKVLAEDIAKLRAAGSLDIEGLYLKLGAAAKQGDQLPLFALPQFQPSAEEAAPPQGWRQRLQSGLGAALTKLNQYIRINRREDKYQPLLAPEYEGAVRQNLHLMFEQAQLAALAGKQKLYEDSLDKAKYWLQNYYKLDQKAAGVLVDTINSLEKERVEVTLPDISGSLRALKAYLENLHEVTPQSTTKPAATETPTATEKPAGNAAKSDSAAGAAGTAL